MCNVEGPPLKKLRPQLLHAAEPLPVYLDFNATTPVCKEAWEAMQACRNHWGNPSSTHPYGLDARFVVEEARAKCLAAFRLQSASGSALGHDDTSTNTPHPVIFTSGGTEANNLAIIGGAHAVWEASVAQNILERYIIVSTNVEHPAVAEVLKAMETQFRVPWTVVILEVCPVSGVLTAEAFKKQLQLKLCSIDASHREVALVSVMHANNEIGSVQPIADLVAVAKELCGPEVLFHTDAAQSIGKVPTALCDLRVDYLSVCSHKFYGPKGVGALIVRPGALPPHRITFGAGHESGYRPGTESIILYAGMAAALEVACRDVDATAVHMRACRDELKRVIEDELGKKRGMRLWVNGSIETALPNTLNIAIEHEPTHTFISAQRLMLDLGHIVCMSAGSACHSSLKEGEAIVVSASLKAVGVNENRAVGTLRLTCGRTSTLEEMRRAGRFIARRAAQQLSDM